MVGAYRVMIRCHGFRPMLGWESPPQSRRTREHDFGRSVQAHRDFFTGRTIRGAGFDT